MFSFPQALKYVQFNLEHANVHGIYVHRPEARSYSMDLQWKKIGGAETGVGFEPRGRGEIDVKYMKM